MKPSLEALQKEWYQKLAASGFDDIEQEIGGKSHYLRSVSNPLRTVPAVVAQATADYYDHIGALANRSTFIKPQHEIILCKHAEGLLLRDIAKLVNMTYLSVLYIVRRYEHTWGVKTYTPPQLNRRKRILTPHRKAIVAAAERRRTAKKQGYKSALLLFNRDAMILHLYFQGFTRRMILKKILDHNFKCSIHRVRGAIARYYHDINCEHHDIVDL